MCEIDLSPIKTTSLGFTLFVDDGGFPISLEACAITGGCISSTGISLSFVRKIFFFYLSLVISCSEIFALIFFISYTMLYLIVYDTIKVLEFVEGSDKIRSVCTVLDFFILSFIGT